MTCLLALAAIACLQSAPEANYQRIAKAVDELLAKGQPKLFAWHLRSIKLLAKAELARVELGETVAGRFKPSEVEKDFKDYSATIAKGLEETCRNPDDYLKHGLRTLVLSRMSDIDGTPQWMMVQLPEGWNPDTAYPLNVGLHGTGPNHPMAYPSFCFPAGKLDTEPHKGSISLTPWGRGNRGWRGDAETDMWEAIATLRTFAKVDEDRWYLSGHSAGADGAWAIALHTPDKWAAVGLQSGSMISGRPESGLFENVKYTPIHILIGENDTLPGRIPDSKQLQELMTKQGTPNKLNIMKGIGHYPLSEEGYRDQDEWMHRFTRKRPSSFSFVADEPQHPGIWGVQFVFDRWSDRSLQTPYPRFDVTISDATVTVHASNWKRLSVKLGPGGLGLKGNVKLLVNGEKAFEGDAGNQAIVVNVQK